ncbi:hypothetical protein BpHYR1_031941 [Brachionus plicatilis]|uniref:Uncharacterized protein n=1 Tax=Brachionus plicatilis TaxID=10195 RepID=A0A3M7T6J5_BRAPC|nr:hypothetical protein BpHYR1_031941 [Brachionus plicatilis]
MEVWSTDSCSCSFPLFNKFLFFNVNADDSTGTVRSFFIHSTLATVENFEGNQFSLLQFYQQKISLVSIQNICLFGLCYENLLLGAHKQTNK